MDIKKLIKKLMIVLVILLVILTIILVLYKKGILKSKNANYPVTGNPPDESIKTLESSNIEFLLDFSGDLPVSTVVKNIKKVFVKKIPNVMEEIDGLSDDELATYYDEKSRNIKRDLRIETEENFMNMVSKMKEVDCDLRKEYQSCDFYVDGSILKFKFTYENGQEVDCQIVGGDADTFLLKF